jgi:hypothetical protein
LLKEHYADRYKHIHIETIIGGAAALTGEFALRTVGDFDPKRDGFFVFGDPINALLYEDASKGGETLWNVLTTMAAKAGVADRDFPDITDILQRVAEGVSIILATGKDAGGFPPLTVPRVHFPHEWSPDACYRLRHHVMAIGKKHELTARQLAFALAMATAGLIYQTRDILDPAISLRLAAEIMFSTAKMAPIDRTYA